MTRIVTGLEKDDLVKRKNDPRDGRLTHIKATAKGHKVLAAGRARRVARLAGAIGKLNRADLAELRRGVQLVGALVANMRDNPA
jgi:DNA-binding MarR family transcriptional regulator